MLIFKLKCVYDYLQRGAAMPNRDEGTLIAWLFKFFRMSQRKKPNDWQPYRKIFLSGAGGTEPNER